MARRSHSTSPAPPEAKRPRISRALTSDDYKDGVVLAPMVRSGALPTRLFALKHGAKLVWGPEIVDKAILHAERVVEPRSGTIQYVGKSKSMFTCHPVEKPYLIYQIGSADPALAVQAAKLVMHDVAGVDLNCGCPKPFSTHSGMGAALLSTPDLLCDILTALRRELPAHISVSAKIRLLPKQEDTLVLVGKILETGINALTVHCRTRNQRMKEPAVIERLREIVEFVESKGKGIAVLANGDCQSFEDAKRVRDVTHAHSVMIATAAESNPTVFSPTPLVDVEQTLIPQYVRLSKYLGNHWSSTKWSIAQFKAPHPTQTKAEHKRARDIIQHAKSYEDILPLLLPDLPDGELSPGALAAAEQAVIEDGERELRAIEEVLRARERARVERGEETAFDAVAKEGVPAALSADVVARATADAGPDAVPAGAAGVADASEAMRVEGAKSQAEAPALGAITDAHDVPAAAVDGVVDGADCAPSGTPPTRPNPELPTSAAPLAPTNPLRTQIPAGVSRQDLPTPTPGGGVTLGETAVTTA